MVIYADVLLAVNLYINYFLVRGTALILRRKITPVRSLLASLVGTGGALVIFLPELHPAVSVMFRALLGFVITLVMFGRQKCIDFAVSMLCFLAVSFTFAGGMIALWNFAAPLGMYYSNGTAYFDIPIGVAAVITAVLFGAFRLTNYIIERRRPARHSQVKIRKDDTEITLDGLADTGNSLRDSFTGKPVILASRSAVSSITPPEVLNYIAGKTDGLEGIRLVPCHTVTADGLIPVFPAEVTINDRCAEVLIGVAKQDISGANCIFDPGAISN